MIAQMKRRGGCCWGSGVRSIVSFSPFCPFVESLFGGKKKTKQSEIFDDVFICSITSFTSLGKKPSVVSAVEETLRFPSEFD